MENKFLVKFRQSQQCTEDHWEMGAMEKMFNETATISEIKAWVKSKTTYSRTDPDFKLFEVTISEPE